jgi:hypothetical protein
MGSGRICRFRDDGGPLTSDHSREENTVRRFRVCQVIVCVLLAGASVHRVRGQAASPPPLKATVDQLAFVTGAWTGTLGDRTIEQHWSAPVAGCIVAMYRSIRSGKPTLYELLAMEQEGDGVVLRIKHFAPGAGLVSREAKDQSIDHRLVSLDGRTAVFQGVDPATPVRITFNSPDPGTLNITVERQQDGKPVSTEFKYSRIKSSASSGN